MRRKQRSDGPRRLRRRTLLLEPLENRRLLVATDLASISGLVFDDFAGNGFDSGEEVAGAVLTLHRDNGDGVFQQGIDGQVGSTTTDSDGRYQFSRLTAGGYFVLQDTQTVGSQTLQRSVSPLTTIDMTAVEGRIVRVIDDFDTTQQSITDETNDGIPVTSSVPAPEAIGGERDLFVNKTSVNGAVQLSVDNPLLPNLLIFDSIATGNGERRVTWDGPDGDATTVDDTGLGQIDLSSDMDALGLQLQIGADQAGINAVVRLYSDDSNGATSNRFSTATLPIPQTGGTVPFLAEFIPYSSFTAAPGGGVDINNVGAIELEITGAANVNGSAELVGTVGQTIFTQNFNNFESADLRLQKSINDPAPTIGQSVTFTVTVNNDGPNTATGVAVRDQLPAGVAFQSASATQGTYNDGSGIWTVGTVASGASATLSIVGRIDSAGSRINFAEVSASDQFDPNSTPDPDNTQPDDTSENDQALVTFVTEAIDLALVKTGVPSTVVVGSNVTFTLTLSNSGPNTATGVVVQDQLPAGISFVSASESQGTYSSSTGRWEVGSVPQGTSPTLTLVGRVDTPGPKTNTAQVLEADQQDVDSTPGNSVPTEDDQDSFSIEAPQIDLSLLKSATPSTVVVGQNVTYTVDLSNAGPSEATGVVVRDQLPAGVTFFDSMVTQGSYDSASGIWTVGSVASGATPRLTIVGRVDQPGTKTNTAEVTAADQPDLDSTPGNNLPSEDDQDSATIEAPQIDLSLSKTASPSSVVVGENVTFTLSLSNVGPSDATGVVVQDLLPAGISFLDSNPSQGGYNAQNGLWTVGTVAAGAAPTLTIIGRVDTPGAKLNTAQVSAADQPDVDSTPGNSIESEDDQDSVTIQAPQIDLSLSKSVDNSIPNVGENINFTLVVSNVGPDTATEVQVRDLLPNGLSFVGSDTNDGTYTVGTGIWDIGSIAAAGNATLIITATPTSTTMITNTAEVISASQPDPDSTPDNNVPSEDDQSSVVIGAQQIDLSLLKSVDQSRPNVGDTIQFEVTVSNDGQSDATGVIVEDVLPSGLVFVSSSPSIGGYNASSGAWTIGNLAMGTDATLVIRARVDAAEFSTNTAQVIAADQVDVDSTPDNDLESEDDQDSVTVSPQVADLSLSKTVGNPRPNVGQNTTFTIAVRNDGPDPATNVAVVDQLPQGVSFVSALPSQGTYDDASGVWTVGSIASQGQVSLQIVGLVETIGTKTNTAQVTSSDQFDPDSTPNNGVDAEDDQASVTVDPPVIDLALDKQIDIARPNVGQTVRYTVVVDNDGPDDASGVVVADELPDGVVFVSSSATSGSYDAAAGRWTIGSIPAQTTATLMIDATVTTTETTTNVAEVFAADQFDSDSTPGDGNPNQDDYGSATFMLADADLSLTKSVDDTTPNVGQDITFTITVTNGGPDPATGVSVIDELPQGLTFVSSTPQFGAYNSSSGIWDIGDLPAGNTATLTLVATSTTATPVTNTAEVRTSDQLDPDSTPGNGVVAEDDQASVEIEGQQIDLSLTKEVDDERPNVGDQIQFTLTALNSGPSRATGVSVRDMLPDGLMYLSSNASQGSYDVASQIWTIGALDNGGNATLQLFARVVDILSVVNTAEVITADQPDSDSTPENGIELEDDQDSAAVTTQVSDLSLTKSASNDRPNVGQQVTFTLTLRNDGPDAATGVGVRDLLPSGLMFVSSNPSQGDYNSQSGIWTVGQVNNRENATLEIVADVLTVGVKTNGAEVVASNQADPDSTPGNDVSSEDDQDTATIDPPLIDLSLDKQASPLRPSVGGPLTFTVTLRNDGPDMATGIVVQDQLPSGTSFVSATPSIGTFDPGTGNWSVASLAAGGTATLQLLTTVDEAGQPTNRVQVTAADQFDSDSTPGNDDGIDGNGNDEDDQSAITVTTASSDLSLSKTVNDDRPGVGSNVTFTIQLANAGPDAADNVVVNDALPSGLSFVSANPTAGIYSAVTGRWTLPSISANTTETLEVVASVDVFGQVTNTGEVIASSQFDPDSVPGNNDPSEDDQDSVTLTPELVDLALSKVVDDASPNVGDTVRFTLELTNEGPSTATGVAVTDQLPDGFTITSVNAGQGVFDPASGIWSVGSVAVGARPQLHINAVVNLAGEKTNIAEVTALDQPDSDSTPNNGANGEDDFASVELIPQIADLEVTQSVNNTTPNQGDELIFTVVLTNEGPDTATGVTVRDLIPSGLNFVRSTQTAGNYNPQSGLWTIASVPSGSTQMLQLVGTVDSRDPINNVAELIMSDQFDPDSTPNNQIPSEDDTDAEVVVPRLIDVSVTASVNVEAPNLGEVVEMVITVRNDGPDDATGLIVDVAVPDGLTILSSVPDRGTFNSPWAIGNLASGESVNLTITARADTRGTKRVEVQVIAHDQADRDSAPSNSVPSEDDQTTLLVLVPLFSKRLFLGGG